MSRRASREGTLSHFFWVAPNKESRKQRPFSFILRTVLGPEKKKKLGGELEKSWLFLHRLNAYFACISVSHSLSPRRWWKGEEEEKFLFLHILSLSLLFPAKNEVRKKPFSFSWSRREKTGRRRETRTEKERPEWLTQVEFA